jgi:AGCS family alanine or glycine:cation symporter
MCVVYVGGALVMILMHAGDVPKYLALIVKHAFTPMAETGACAGVSIWIAFEWGLRRACFSNEAGEGSAAMAHAAARTDEPVREGVVAGIGPFIDTIIICTMSALVILMSGAWNRPAVGEVVAVSGDGNTITVQCSEEMSEEWESLYLARIAPKKTLAVHTVREMGKELERVTPEIVAIEGSTDNWSALGKLTLDASELDPKDREAIAVGQEVHLEMDGAEMTGFAFDTTLPGFGKYMVTLAVCLFGFSTMISWSYYGEKGAEYLLGPGAILPYKFMFVIFVFLGMVLEKFTTVYDFSDATTGLMVLCNLPAVLILSPVVVRAARDYFRRLDAGEMKRRTR